MADRTVPSTSERLRRAVTGLDEVIDAVEAERAWDRPTPCAGWVARDVVTHLADWTPFVLERVGRTRPDPDLPAVERWRFVAAALQAILDDPAESATEIETGPPGRMPAGQAIRMFVLGDVVVHTWDLARSIGLDVELADDVLAEQLDDMRQMEQAIRDSGHFGPAMAVPDGAPVRDRALAFTGRDPAWTPTT